MTEVVECSASPIKDSLIDDMAEAAFEQNGNARTEINNITEDSDEVRLNHVEEPKKIISAQDIEESARIGTDNQLADSNEAITEECQPNKTSIVGNAEKEVAVNDKEVTLLKEENDSQYKEEVLEINEAKVNVEETSRAPADASAKPENGEMEFDEARPVDDFSEAKEADIVTTTTEKETSVPVSHEKTVDTPMELDKDIVETKNEEKDEKIAESTTNASLEISSTAETSRGRPNRRKSAPLPVKEEVGDRRKMVRDRKKIERFSGAWEQSSSQEKSAPEPSAGLGVALSEVSRIAEVLSKLDTEELFLFYKMCFGSSRTSMKPKARKELLLKFNGWDFAKDDKKVSARRDFIKKQGKAQLVLFADIFELKAKTVEEIVNGIVDYLKNPQALDSTKYKTKKFNSSAGKTKSAGKDKKGGRGRQKRRSTSKKVKDESEEEENDVSADDYEDEEEEAVENGQKNKSKEGVDDRKEEGAEEEEQADEEGESEMDSSQAESSGEGESPKRKSHARRKSGGGGGGGGAKGRTAAKRSASTADKVTSPKKARKEDVSSKKVTSGMPSNKDLEKTVKELMKDADLDKVTMKNVCDQVYKTYPHVDLTTRREFIKETVKKVLADC